MVAPWISGCFDIGGTDPDAPLSYPVRCVEFVAGFIGYIEDCCSPKFVGASVAAEVVAAERRLREREEAYREVECFAVESPGFDHRDEVELRHDGGARVSSGRDNQGRSLSVPARVGLGRQQAHARRRSQVVRQVGAPSRGAAIPLRRSSDSCPEGM